MLENALAHRISSHALRKSSVIDESKQRPQISQRSKLEKSNFCRKEVQQKEKRYENPFSMRTFEKIKRLTSAVVFGSFFLRGNCICHTFRTHWPGTGFRSWANRPRAGDRRWHGAGGPRVERACCRQNDGEGMMIRWQARRKFPLMLILKKTRATFGLPISTISMLLGGWHLDLYHSGIFKVITWSKTFVLRTGIFVLQTERWERGGCETACICGTYWVRMGWKILIPPSPCVLLTTAPCVSVQKTNWTEPTNFMIFNMDWKSNLCSKRLKQRCSIPTGASKTAAKPRYFKIYI